MPVRRHHFVVLEDVLVQCEVVHDKSLLKLAFIGFMRDDDSRSEKVCNLSLEEELDVTFLQAFDKLSLSVILDHVVIYLVVFFNAIVNFDSDLWKMLLKTGDDGFQV